MDRQINKKLEILLSSDTPVGIYESMGLGMIFSWNYRGSSIIKNLKV